jgi:solute carrier family 25 oxoglutarate transporter 11
VGTYDHSKRFILAEGWLTEGFAAHCAASMLAGFVAAVATSPVDVLKTR